MEECLLADDMEPIQFTRPSSAFIPENLTGLITLIPAEYIVFKRHLLSLSLSRPLSITGGKWLFRYIQKMMDRTLANKNQ